MDEQLKGPKFPPGDGHEVQALIVAGGRGTRLGLEIPKQLVRVGNSTLVESSVARLLLAGVRRIHFSLSHAGEEIAAYLTGALPPGVEARFLVEARPRGTIGSLEHLAGSGVTTLVTNADLVTDLDFNQLLKSHRQQAADLTIAVHVEKHSLDFGEVLVDEHNRVVEYLEKPTKSYSISSGMYAIEDEVIGLIAAGEKLGAPDLIRRALGKGLKVRTFPHSAHWLDVNNSETLALARALCEANPSRFPSPCQVLENEQ